MIKILNSDLELLAVLKDTYNPYRYEEINGENTLSFTAILTDKNSTYINENNVVELDGEYFDIAYYSKDLNKDGTCTMQVECEHISYRLNDEEYNKDYFTSTGTPTAVLTEILDGTNFTIDTIDFTDSVTYSAQEPMSRRQLLMQFVATLGGEIKFDKFNISILTQRGSTDIKIYTKGKNIKVISKIYDHGDVAYTCTPLLLPDKEIALGDDILLIQSELNIEDTLRVVSLGYNPYNKMEAKIEIANYINTLENQIYRIETTTVAKEKVYHGVKIGPDDGLVIERSDKLARSKFNSDTFEMSTGDGTGVYVPVIYFDAVAQKYKFDGYVTIGNLTDGTTEISGENIQTGTITADAIDSGTITADKIATNAITADKISTNAITADKINANAITSTKIATNAITSTKIATNAITADKILANAITADKINANAITSTKIATNAITSTKIAARAITASKLDVDSLSAVSANLGTVTAGTLTGVDINADTFTAENKITIDYDRNGDGLYFNKRYGTTLYIKTGYSNSLRHDLLEMGANVNVTNGLYVDGERAVTMEDTWGSENALKFRYYNNQLQYSINGGRWVALANS